MIAQAGMLMYNTGTTTPWEETTITQRYVDKRGAMCSMFFADASWYTITL